MRVFELVALSVLLPAIAGAKAHGPNVASLYSDTFIKDLNEKIPNQQWVAGKHFESFDDVRPLLGVRENKERVERHYREGSLEAVENYQAPDSYDLRQVWKNCKSLQMVWDQGACGSDWAIASTSAFSDRICILREARPEDGQQIISPEDLMTCCWRCGDGTCNGGGGDVYDSWAWFEAVGVTTGGPYGDKETCKPYSFAPCDHHNTNGKYPPCSPNPKMPACEHDCKNDYYNRHGQTYATDKRQTRDNYYVRKTEDHIMEELQTRGSITAVFNVYADFPAYKSGVYQHVSGDLLGVHAVRVVGWGTENGVKYWIAINSWNEGWGDKGAFKIRRGVDECGIESKMVGGQAMYLDPFGP